MEETTNKRKKKDNKKLYYIGLGLIGVAIILVIVFLLRGETKTYGEFSDPESVSSLRCGVTGFSYPFFEYDNSTKRTTEMNATFSDDKLDKISLEYTLTYSNPESIIDSEAINHGAMNKRFSDEGLGTDALSSTYGRLSDGLKYNIWADLDTINKNPNAPKYFLLDSINNKSYSKEEVKKVYRQKGFKCED